MPAARRIARYIIIQKVLLTPKLTNIMRKMSEDMEMLFLLKIRSGHSN
jgi:hypothetical protein